MSTHNGLKGGMFGAALAVLIFFLKIICPLTTGCLVDPFLVILFSPLYLFEWIGLSSFVTTVNEPFLILGFWACIGFLVGYLVSPLFSDPTISEIERD